MYVKFLIIPSLLVMHVASGQNNAESLSSPQSSAQTPAPAAQPAAETAPVAGNNQQNGDRIAIMDYKSVYEAPTLEEEIKLATERFNLSPDQQEMWSLAATDRRRAEQFAKDKLASNAASYERDGIYRGLRTAQNDFYEVVTGHLSPKQKQLMENDRLIIEEKQKRLAKQPPPPPPAPTVTAAPVDSAAIKETEKGKTKKKTKKSKRKG